MPDVSSPEFWEGLYDQRAQPWDLGAPTPALVDCLDATPPAPGRVAVPGCGRGHDVRYLTQQGYDAVGFDFSGRAVAAARYCAIDPARRAAYVDALAAIVRPGGFLLACFFPTGGVTGGPPFPVDVDEMRALVGRAFRIEREFAPPRSADGRQGRELVVYALRTAC